MRLRKFDDNTNLSQNVKTCLRIIVFKRNWTWIERKLESFGNEREMELSNLIYEMQKWFKTPRIHSIMKSNRNFSSTFGHIPIV